MRTTAAVFRLARYSSHKLQGPQKQHPLAETPPSRVYSRSAKKERLFPVCPVGDLPPGERRIVNVDGRSIGVFCSLWFIRNRQNFETDKINPPHISPLPEDSCAAGIPTEALQPGSIHSAVGIKNARQSELPDVLCGLGPNPQERTGASPKGKG